MNKLILFLSPLFLCFLSGCDSDYMGASSRLKRDILFCEYLELEIQHRKTCKQCHGTMHIIIDDINNHTYKNNHYKS